MRYYSTETGDRRRRWAGGMAAAAYILFWVVLMFALKFSMAAPEETGEGILINFGDTEQAGGTADPRVNDQTAQVPQTSASSAAQTEVVTQDNTDAPAVETRRTPRPTPVEQPQEKPREVDPRALFPGRTAGSNSPSEGQTTGAGNQGHLAGDPSGAHDGTGTGDSGVSFDLHGRRPIGEVKPDYTGNERDQWTVKIRVTVNPRGEVVRAEYQAQGSTTNNRGFVDEALKAARRQKFSASEEDNLQAGVITYVFNVK